MLEVITGCMYSGKSEELIRRLRRCKIAGQRILVFKSSVDNRYSEDEVATHPIEGRSDTLGARKVSSSSELESILESEGSDCQVVGFDEVQFMDQGVVEILELQAALGKRVIVAGIDLDSDGRPFGPMAELLSVADDAVKLSAVCVAKDQETGATCGKQATRSFRVKEASNGQLVQVGSDGVYEARCRTCWWKGMWGSG
jgi:thymidine kinase